MGENPLLPTLSINQTPVSWEECVSYSLQLKEISGALSWALADHWNRVSQKFSPKSMAIFANSIGENKSTVTNYIFLSKAFPPEKRIPAVSFTNHYILSHVDEYNAKEDKFEGEERFKWLEKAADNEWSTRDLISKIHEEKTKSDLGTDILPCTKCGQGPEVGEVKQYVFFAPGVRKEATRTELHVSCFDDVVGFAKAARNVVALN